MKGKKILVAIISTILVCATAGFLSACELTHSHSYTENVVGSTCQAQGYTEYTCSCGHSYQDNFVEKLAHEEITEIKAVEPDCTNVGYTAKIVCEECGDVLQARTELPAKGHDHANNPCKVCGKEYETPSEQFVYTLQSDDTYSIRAKDPSKLPSRVVIPSSYEGKNVTTIEDSAFINASVETIKLPATIINVGSNAFSGCTSLKNINIPNSVSVISASSFEGCAKLIAYCEIKVAPSGWESGWDSAITSFVLDVLEFGVTNDGFEWAKLNINMVTISKYHGTQTNVKIPASIGDCVVGAVHNNAFSGLDNIVSVEIPDSVTSIGDKAFSGCEKLESVVLPENLTSLGEKIFDLCEKLEKILFKGDVELWVALKAELFGDELVITITVYYYEPENPNKTGNYWYYDSDNNTQFYPPHVHTPVEDKEVDPTCTETGLTVGSHCDVCKEVLVEQQIVPKNGHTPVEDNAVEPTCAETGLTAGSHCDVCKEVLVEQETVLTKPHTEVEVKSIDPTCEEKGQTAGIKCDVCKKIISGCVEIPANGHTEIEDKAVEPTCTTSGLTAGIHCDVCKKVLVAQEIVPARHNFVDGECNDCGAIQPTDDSYFTYTLLSDDTYSIKAKDKGNLPNNVIIPSTYNGKAVTVIENSAFERNTMQSVRIPSSIIKLGSRSFLGSWFLESVVFDDKSNLKIIEKQAFYESTKLVSINLPNGVTIIEEDAFYYCGLLEIIIPNSLTNIGNDAFYNNTKLRKVTFEQNSQLATIGDYAFSRCGIFKIEIPLSVTTMGEFVFEYCDNIIICCEATSKPSGWANYWNVSSSSYSTHSVIWNCKNNNVDSSGRIYLTIDGIFYGIKNYEAHIYEISLTGNVIIPSSVVYNKVSCPVVSIDSNVFTDANSVTSLEIPFIGSLKNGTGSTEFGYIFGGAENIPSNLTVKISGVESIPDNAFSGCSNISGIEISNTVKTIGVSAFSGCTGLVSIELPTTITTIGNYAFSQCSSLKTIQIPDKVTSLSSYIFNECSSLTSVNFSESSKLVYIREFAFYCCTSLSEMTIPKTVTKIENNAFYYCSNLESINIPTSVKQIGKNVFYGCKNLKTISFEYYYSWYRTTSSSNWNNKQYGTYMTVSDFTTNVTNFVTTYASNYWYCSG